MIFRFNIEPVPLGRARVTKRGVYLPKRSQAFKHGLQQAARAQFSGEKLTGALKLTVHFSKNINPQSRRYGDIDNLVKAVLDAFNGVIFDDDAQVVELHAYKHKGAPQIDMEVKADVCKDTVTGREI